MPTRHAKKIGIAIAAACPVLLGTEQQLSTTTEPARENLYACTLRCAVVQTIRGGRKADDSGGSVIKSQGYGYREARLLGPSPFCCDRLLVLPSFPAVAVRSSALVAAVWR